MLKIALVGNIASGKSTVEKILFSRGYCVLDTDNVSHKLLEECKEVKKAFKNFEVFDNDGNISREKLGKLIFSDQKLKKKLEDILYPQIRIKIREFFTESEGENFVFVAVPLLYEAGMEDLFDKVLFIYTDDEIRLERLIKRNNFSREYAKTRLAAQDSQDEKVKKADWVIYNNSTPEDLEVEVLGLLKQI